MPHLDLESLIETVGYIGLFVIVFAETGLLIGFFLPGDTLLVTAGLLASQGTFEIWILILVLLAAAILGDATGYAIGRATGPRLFKRDESRFFKRSHLQRAELFYEKHGGKTIVLARFLPIVRTFAPTVAGAANMPYPKFAFYNVFGAGLWVFSTVLLGYFVGENVPNPDLVFPVLVGVILLLSVAPAAIHILRERARAASES